MLSYLLVGANSAVAACYFAIAFLIFQGLMQAQQNLLKNPLVVATAAIFFTCALGHSAHIFVMAAGEEHSSLPLMSVQVGFDLVTAVVAVTYLALRRHYSLLIDGPLLLDHAQNQLAQANEKLSKINVNLESLVAERTEELLKTNQQLKREITERKQNQEALKQSEERYRSLVVATSQIVWTTNPDGQVVDMPQWRAYTGQSQQAVKGWGWLDALQPEDRDRVAKIWSHALATKSLYNAEYRVRGADGNYRYFSVRGVPVLAEDGSIREWVGTCSDISDRKQTEQALQESYSILHAVIEGTTDSVFMKDLQGRYVMINSAGAKVVGKPVENIVGKDDTELFPSHIALPIIENDRRLIAVEENQTYEDIIPFMGKLRTFLAAKTVCRNAQGKVIGLVGIARDISDRKRAEQQIKQLNQNLERRVVERTAQLEVANKELEAFSYSVSHDLRAPLRSIDGFSLALLERYTSQLDDKGKHYLQRVRAATGRMGQLIDDLLNLSRVTRSQMQRSYVDLTALVKAIAADTQQTQPERSNVEFVIEPGVVAQGDSRLLRVVLENLLNNAWKFTSKQVSPLIEFGTVSQADGTTAYFVRDNGAGFDIAYAHKLFRAFQRLHTEDEFPGTGIGLATVQRIIHRHGGRVWAEGALDQGATFYFTL
jgi:PAS domain S-box-containing protein